MNSKADNRKILMANYNNPSNFSKKIPEGYTQVSSKSDTCLDSFEIFVKLNGDVIEDIKFNGEGCSVSTASLNMTATYLIGKTKKEGVEFLTKYSLYIKEGKEEGLELNDLVVFQNIHVHLNRITCALIGPKSIITLLEK